jgi:plasmid stabilization system protein ParE
LNGCQHIEITESAQADLLSGYWFYEHQKSGLGQYFLDGLSTDIDSLLIYAGVHIKPHGGELYRTLSKRFPYAIYYTFAHQLATVIAVLDTRRNPEWLRHALTARSN